MTSQSKFPPELKAVKYNGVGTQLTEGLSEQLGVSFLRLRDFCSILVLSKLLRWLTIMEIASYNETSTSLKA